MAFSPASRNWSVEKYPTKASTTYTAGMMLYSDGTDVVPATTTTQSNIIGIAQESKASAANTNAIHVLVPNSVNSTFYADNGSGTLTAAQVGDQFDFASGGLTIDQAASTYDPVILVKYHSATKGTFKFNYTRGIEN